MDSSIFCRMLLRLAAISKVFGNFKLEPLDLEVNSGEFFCLLGPSGCGKTTVLRLIGGFERASSGQILLNDENITKLAPHQRNIHTVFQRYALFPHLNVYDNVAFSLKLKKVPKSEIESRVSEALKLVEIEPLKDRRIHQISGGQAQRVAVARALVGKPSILLLDEPLSALDPALRLRMREELRALCKRVGVTFIMVTHDQEEALQLSDRLAVMKDGRCLQIGTPKSVYEDPNDAFVARFIGPTNEIPGELMEGAEEYRLHSPLGNFRIKKNGVAYPKQIQLILRPEKMRLLRQRSNTQENLIEGQVSELNYLGSRTEYTVKTSCVTFRVFEPELERLKKKSLSTGDKIFLTWKSEDAIVLPQKGLHE